MANALAILISVLSWAAALIVLVSAAGLPRRRQGMPGAIGSLLLCVPPVMLVWRTGDAKLGMTFVFLGAVIALFVFVFAPLRARLLGFGGPEDAAAQAELERRWAARRTARKVR